jgi:hypothetical protein
MQRLFPHAGKISPNKRDLSEIQDDTMVASNSTELKACQAHKKAQRIYEVDTFENFIKRYVSDVIHL